MIPHIEFKNISFLYEYSKNKYPVLNNINLSINHGETVGIIGHTGAGKSTLVKMCNGLIKPDQGEILLNGTNIWKKKKLIKDLRFKVGMVFQYPEYQLFESTVYRDIAFGLKNLKLDKAEVDKRIKDTINLVGLNENFLELSPFQLSGGQKRRVAIAGVLVMKPEFLLLDEPAAGLDPKGRKEIFSLIEEYKKQNNATVIIVSHSMDDVMSYADKVLVLHDGRNLMFDTPENVFSKYEILSKIGLDVPQITRIFFELKRRKVNVSTSIFNINDAVTEITQLFERRNLKTVI